MLALPWDAEKAAEVEARKREEREALLAKKAAEKHATAMITAERAEGERLATLRYLDDASDEASASGSTKPADAGSGEPAGDELLRTLSQLDEQRLIGALEREDIRLVRADWLRAQPPGYRIQRRQALEETEANHRKEVAEEDGVDGWPVRQLKEYVAAHGGDAAGFTEKREYVDEVRRLRKESADPLRPTSGRRRQMAVVAASSPLLSGAEAVALLRKAQRAVAVLSYGRPCAARMRSSPTRPCVATRH